MESCQIFKDTRSKHIQYPIDKSLTLFTTKTLNQNFEIPQVFKTQRNSLPKLDTKMRAIFDTSCL